MNINNLQKLIKKKIAFLLYMHQRAFGTNPGTAPRMKKNKTICGILERGHLYAIYNYTCFSPYCQVAKPKKQAENHKILWKKYLQNPISVL